MKRASYLALLSAASLWPTAARADGTPLRIAAAATDSFAEGIYGDAGGFFKQSGLETTQLLLNNTGAIASAVAGGSADIGCGNPVSLASAVISGLPFVAIAPGALFQEARPTSMMIVEKASSVRSATDLVGKTVALVEIAGMTLAASRGWLRKGGVDPANVKFIEISMPAMIPALTAGRIDAAFIGEQFLIPYASDTRIIGSPYAALAPQWYLNLWFVTRSWLEKNGPTARSFAQAIVKTAAWANAHQSETAAILEKNASLPPDVLAKMARVQFATKFDLGYIQPVLDAAFREGSIKRAIDAHEFLMVQ